MARDRIIGPWNGRFQLLYTYKTVVKMASPDSVVDIDKHIVDYKVRGNRMEKECFRKVFFCSKACWQGFLGCCGFYLVVDATDLNGRFRA
jgi:hypothetical protein